MKKLLPLLLLSITLLTACGNKLGGSTRIELSGQEFVVAIAQDAESKKIGLMEREALDDDNGMLFVYEEAGPRVFWMKDMDFPIDILYFDSNQRLVQIYDSLPPCEEEPCSRYPSTAFAQFVLEIPAGSARQIGAKVGDEFKFLN